MILLRNKNVQKYEKDALNTKKGFSVIELAVAVSVAATVAVGYLVWAKPENQNNAEKIALTKQRMHAIEEAISYFFVDERRLPCPADPLTRADGSKASGARDTDFGRESIDLAITGVTCPLEVGTAPVISLGLDETYAFDAWGRQFTYQISDALCGNDSASSNPNEADSCSAQDFSSGTADLTINDHGGTGILSNAAYVLVSHGPDGIGGVLPSGEVLVGTPNENSDGDTTYQFINISDNNTDLLAFKTKTQIDSVALDPIGTVISSTACNENSNTLANISNTDESTLNNNADGLNNFQLTTNNVSKNSGSELVIGTLIGIQTLCIEYFSNTADASIGWNGPACPGGGVFDTSENVCVCLDGSWDGDCTI